MAMTLRSRLKRLEERFPPPEPELQGDLLPEYREAKCDEEWLKLFDERCQKTKECRAAIQEVLAHPGSAKLSDSEVAATAGHGITAAYVHYFRNPPPPNPEEDKRIAEGLDRLIKEHRERSAKVTLKKLKEVADQLKKHSNFITLWVIPLDAKETLVKAIEARLEATGAESCTIDDLDIPSDLKTQTKVCVASDYWFGPEKAKAWMEKYPDLNPPLVWKGYWQVPDE